MAGRLRRRLELREVLRRLRLRRLLRKKVAAAVVSVDRCLLRLVATREERNDTIKTHY